VSHRARLSEYTDTLVKVYRYVSQIGHVGLATLYDLNPVNAKAFRS